MSPAAEIRGVTVAYGLGAPCVLEKVPLWAHLLGRGLEELPSGRRTGWRAAFGPLESPTLRAGAPEAPTDAVDWKGGVACICSRPEGATEVVLAPGISPGHLLLQGLFPNIGGTRTGSQWVLAPRDLLFPKPRACSPSPTPHPVHCRTTHVRLSLRGTKTDH